MIRRTFLAFVVTASNLMPALAESIDLSKPWGNKNGCANRVQQEYYSENMLLLTKEALVTSGSACTIEKTQTEADGSLVLDTSCEYEGGDAEKVRFTVRRFEKGLRLLGPDGGDYGEISLCR